MSDVGVCCWRSRPGRCPEAEAVPSSVKKNQRPFSPYTLVLCPMSVEVRTITRSVLNAGPVGHVHFERTGVGKGAVVRALEKAVGDLRPAVAILAGACGGLRETEDVPNISRVIDEHGGSWTPTNAAPGGVTLIGVDRIISTPKQKHDLAERTGASIVDMEAHAFAEACERLGIAWAVVRGVSDTPDETLPGEVLGWIRPDGGTRAMRAVVDMVRKPLLVRNVLGFVRRMNRVLPAVGDEVVRVVREFRVSGKKTNPSPGPFPQGGGA